METDVIRFIALCGYPKAGKTEVQRIISRRYGFASYDDSKPLREAAKSLYGLTEWHVTTQEGKASLLQVGNMKVTVRKAMGDLGCYLEEQDEFHFPRLAVQTCGKLDPEGRFVFASVRRNQPTFFKSTNQALVIEVTRDGCKPSDSFDEYVRDPVDFSIENYRNPENPEQSLRDLEIRVARMLDPILMTPGISKATASQTGISM
jgi:hypothetical protein